MPRTAQRLDATGTVSLEGDAFEARFHRHLVHEAVRAELNARRQGTASTLTRGEVRGGGSKPWRQKGTGRARAGSIRSPLWAGGGIAFGPKPRHYTVKMNRKARRAALRSALSLHAERGSIAVADPAVYDDPSTRKAADALAAWGQPGPTLVLLAEAEGQAAKSFRNLWNVTVMPVSSVGVADLVGAASLVVSETALAELKTRAAGAADAAANGDGEEA